MTTSMEKDDNNDNSNNSNNHAVNWLLFAQTSLKFVSKHDSFHSRKVFENVGY